MTTFTLAGDIKFFYGTSPGAGDIRVSGSDLLRDPGFETAVLISLLTNARASKTDKLPPTHQFRGGYFGSLLTGNNIGSKLWLLARVPLDDTTLRLTEQYVSEALSWMQADSIASNIEVVATRGVNNQVNFSVSIERDTSENVFFSFYANWQYQTIGGLAA